IGDARVRRLDAPRGADVVSHLRKTAEIELRATSRFLERQAGAHVFVDRAIEMKPQLVVEIRLGAAAAEQGPQANSEIAPHGEPQAVPMTRATAVVRRLHAAFSASSCFRPRAVNS